MVVLVRLVGHVVKVLIVLVVEDHVVVGECRTVLYLLVERIFVHSDKRFFNFLKIV